MPKMISFSLQQPWHNLDIDCSTYNVIFKQTICLEFIGVYMCWWQKAYLNPQVVGGLMC